MAESNYEQQRAYIREVQQKAAEAIRSIDPSAKVHETGSFMCFGNYMPPNKFEAIGFSLVENVSDRTRLVLKPDFRKKATVEDLQAMQQELLAQGVEVTIEGGIIDTQTTTPFSRIYGNRNTETAPPPSVIPERERKESGPVPTERPEKPKAEEGEVEAENNVLRLYLFGEMSDDDKEKFEAAVDADPVLQTELQKLQEKLESDWYGKKLTGEQQKRLWELYVVPHRSELKNKHAKYLRDFLIQVQMSGDTRIMPDFLKKE